MSRPQERAALGLAWALALWAPAAQAQVPVDRTELSGAIAGRVCRDLDGDGRCSAGEPGAAGVRVVLETGQESITDALGRYSFAAVGAREVQPLEGRWYGGRHRLRVDVRALPAGAEVTPAATTVEVTQAALVLQDFALRLPKVERPTAAVAHQAQPPAAELRPGGAYRFLAAGAVAPGSTVEVEGVPAEVRPDGLYRAWVVLREGPNELSVSVRSEGGVVSLYRQRVDVIAREAGALIVPRPLEPAGSIQLPATAAVPAAAGRSALRVEGPPGATVSHPGGEAVIPPGGAVEIPLELRPGDNQVPLSVSVAGGPKAHSALSIPARPRPLLLGLVDLELSLAPRTVALRLHGRGAGHGELQLGEWTARAQLDLRDLDRDAVRDGGAATLLLPRRPEALERVLDPDRFPLTLGDDATVLTPNAPEGRLRLELTHERFGGVGFGTFAPSGLRAEVGRYRRTLFGPWARLAGRAGERLGGSVEAYFASGAVDPVRPLSTAPARSRFLATGGSVYYLGHSTVSQGSERVRVELYDALSELPLAERHLVRGQDYEIDYASGRVLLERPLSFFHAPGLLQSDPLGGGVVRALVVDYERVILGPGRDAWGARLRGDAFGVEVGAALSREVGGVGRYQLVSADLSAPLGRVTLLANAAVSLGRAQAADGFSISDDGGLSAQLSEAEAAAGSAVSLRLRGGGLTEKGAVELAFRTRSAGFSDAAHLDAGRFRQLAARVSERLGPLVFGVHADDRLAADPRRPLAPERVASRNLGGFVGYETADWGVRLEARDTSLTAPEDPFVDPAQLGGGRTGVGASAFYRLSPSVRLVAAHRQALARRGEGLGAVDDTFSSAGVDLRLGERAGLELRGGYGPRLGPQAWVNGYRTHGEDTFYGSYSADVDGPELGSGRAVFGARTELDGRTFAFVEEVAAHDTRAVRTARAVGLTRQLADGLSLSLHYERGSGSTLVAPAPFFRDSGGASASWTSGRVRLYARGEYRHDRGRSLMSAVSRQLTQRVISAAAEVALLENLRASARLNLTDAWAEGAPLARGVEGAAVLAWRLERAAVVARYGLSRELAPPTRGPFGERLVHTASLMPSLDLGRFALAAGGHAAFGAGATVLTGTLRPSAKVWEGLELAAELARRTSAPEGEALGSVRGEVGYRFQPGLMLAVGYTFYGFTGLGLPDGGGSQDRLYLRAELSH